VEAIEDRSKSGIVLYDPRADWKLKADIVVIVNGVAMRVSAFVGNPEERPRIEQRRDQIERMRKKNTSESSHWGNTALDQMRTFEICRTDKDLQIVDGCRLFSIDAVNRLLEQLYDHGAVDPQQRYSFRVPSRS
jgi:hypothetical protein